MGAGIAQHPHPGRFVASGLVDRAFPEARLIIEADGRRWHERRAANLADLRRDRAAAVEGWLTVRYTFDDLVLAPESAAEELALIHRRRVLDARHRSA
jgi:very-short-patch-repair endonuclease